jgi:carbamoyltransferase
LEAKRDFFSLLADLGIPFAFTEHHLCHAASAFYCTDWEEAAGLVIDGHGSKYETQGIYHCRGNTLTPVASSSRPGIGWMYSAVTERLLGFEHLQDGKTMGLAGWARDGGIWKHLFKGVCDPVNPSQIFYPQFVEETFPWRMSVPEGLPVRRKADDPAVKPFAQYAFAAQAELETSVMKLIQATARLVPSKRLCYSGGVALNILANRQILDAGFHDDFFIQPAASDAGIPLGAALYGYHCVLQGEYRWKMEHAFLGRSYTAGQVSAALRQWPGSHADASVEKIAGVLANDYLVAWWQGAAEFGPRALGHRSILCLPRHPQMKDYLNREVKHREMFRPFAPIVPEEKQSEYFDLDVPSPYMLINATVRPHIAPLIPAVVHADGTARVQSISQSQQPDLHALLLEVGSITGIPVLLNTSLNLAGEPIVETPADAVNLFARSRLDALVLGSWLLSKVPFRKMMETPNPGLHEVEAPVKILGDLCAVALP